MNEGRIWLYVNPSVGLPLFFLVWVAGVALSIHLAILTNTTWFAAFWQGGAAFAAPPVLEPAPAEIAPPSRKKASGVHLPRSLALRTLVVMIATAISSSLLFNFTTNGNAQLLAQRLDGLVNEPVMLGLLLALVYAVASFAQVIVGRLIDTVPIKPLFFGILALQGVVFFLSAGTSGWTWYAAAIVYMVAVFAAIPFNDAMVVRYIDDSIRSRVSGTRIAISFGFSSLAVYMLGPVVKQAGFTTLMLSMSVIAAIGACFVFGLPGEEQMRASRQEA